MFLSPRDLLPKLPRRLIWLRRPRLGRIVAALLHTPRTLLQLRLKGQIATADESTVDVDILEAVHGSCLLVLQQLNDVVQPRIEEFESAFDARVEVTRPSDYVVVLNHCDNFCLELLYVGGKCQSVLQTVAGSSASAVNTSLLPLLVMSVLVPAYHSQCRGLTAPGTKSVTTGPVNHTT